MSLTALKPYKWTMLWALVIAVLSLMPAKSIAIWSWNELFQLDKLVHAFVYGGLYLIWLIEMGKSKAPIRVSTGPLIACAAYGVLLEVLQSKMYLGRHFDVLDIIANIIGLLIAYWLAGKVFK